MERLINMLNIFERYLQVKLEALHTIVFEIFLFTYTFLKVHGSPLANYMWYFAVLFLVAGALLASSCARANKAFWSGIFEREG